MNEGVSGWYGLWAFLAIAGLVVTVLAVLGAGALRLMLKDDVYYPEER